MISRPLTRIRYIWHLPLVVLFNDVGTGLSVTAFDATSVQGAAVTIFADGAAEYDPAGAPALQALDDGESVVDTVTYTVTDFSFATTVATVEVTVDGGQRRSRCRRRRCIGQ